ncbi:hypothetical protein GQR58_028133 [Nymphon striatum]|nr:hypothetical protein GQR58_028133 [Nymphon striatum]
MADILVTTNLDDTNPLNSAVSLREALAIAAGTVEADTITFQAGLTSSALSPTEGTLTIAAGQNVVINGDTNGDGVADVNIDGQNSSRLFTVEAGATLFLRSVNLVNGYDYGTYGSSGTYGTPGTYGADGGNPGYGYANWGSAGYDGGDGTDWRQAAAPAVPVSIGGMSATGGYGGDGASGAAGGNGGSGGYGVYGGYAGMYSTYSFSTEGGPGGNGGAGGAGGDGGAGGNGGDAATIFNAAGASLFLSNSALGAYIAQGTTQSYYGNLSATGGRGGYGGSGAYGGYGGNGGQGGQGGTYGGGYYTSNYYLGGAGGNGGDGGAHGDGGDGGTGGRAAGGILNFGTLSASSNIAVSTTGYAPTSGAGGYGGYAGNGVGAYSYNGGSGGQGGYDGSFTFQAPNGVDGIDGAAGLGGSVGSAGAENDVFLNAGSGTGTIATEDSIIYLHKTDLVMLEGDGGGATTFTFNINRIGDFSEDVSVDWSVFTSGGLTAADFTTGMVPSGTVTFTAYTEVTHTVTFDVLADDLVEGNETIGIQLSNLTDMVGGATQGLGTSLVSGTIQNDDYAYELRDGPGGTGSLFGEGNDYDADLKPATFSGDYIRVVDASYFAGPQTLTIDADNVTLEADAPFDGLISLDNVSGVVTFTIDGDTNADVNGNANDNIITGGAGDNTFLGGMGNDTLNGGEGNDDLQGGSDNDYLDGYWGDDTMVGGSGDDTMLGNLGKDDMFGSTGADSMNGGLGADTLDGGGPERHDQRRRQQRQC